MKDRREVRFFARGVNSILGTISKQFRVVFAMLFGKFFIFENPFAECDCRG